MLKLLNQATYVHEIYQDGLILGLALGDQVMCHSFVSCFMQLTSTTLVFDKQKQISYHTRCSDRICNRDGVLISLSRGGVISHAISVSIHPRD